MKGCDTTWLATRLFSAAPCELCLLLHAIDRGAELTAQKVVDREMRIDDRLQARDRGRDVAAARYGPRGGPTAPVGRTLISRPSTPKAMRRAGRAPVRELYPHISLLRYRFRPILVMTCRTYKAATTGPNFTCEVSIGPPGAFSPIEPSLRRRPGSRRRERLCRSQQESGTGPILMRRQPHGARQWPTPRPSKASPVPRLRSWS